MSLRVIAGGANAGASPSVRAFVRDGAARGGRALLLVPSAPDAVQAVSESAEAGIIGLTVRSFDGHLDEIWRQYGDGRVIAGRAQRLAVLEEVASSWAPEQLTSQRDSPGLVRLMSRLVQRCAEGEALADVSRCGPVVRDLLAFADAYMASLTDAGLIERTAAHRLAVGLLEKVSIPGVIGVDGFTGFTAPQEAFLRSAAERAEVAVSLTYDASIPATVAAKHVINRLTTGAELRIEPPTHSSEPPELARIAQSLGTPGTGEVSATGAVALSEAWGAAAEAARVVSDTQRLITEGVRPGSIAVVFRDVAPHLKDLAPAFREAGISVEVDATVPFSTTPLGRLLSMLVRIDTLEHDELMDVMRSPYSPAPNDLLDRFDASARRRRQRPRGASSAAAWFRQEHPETASFLARCRRACGSMTAEDAQREWYALVSGMLVRAHDAQGQGLGVDAAAAREFMEAVAAAAGLRADGMSRLTTILNQSTVALDSTGAQDSVQVMSAERVRGRRWECVILGGLTDGVFPRGATEDALTDASVVHEFADVGVDVAPRSGVGEERLLFYQVVTRATQRLILSRQTHDAEGRPLRPSIFWEELLDLYRDPVTREYYAGEPPIRTLGLDALAMDPHAPRTRRRMLRSLAMDGQRGAPEPGGEPVLREATRRARRLREPLSEAAKREADARRAFSASEIEAYLRCPFQWCIAHLVRPRELDRSLDAAATGRLGHEIMRRFYEEYRDQAGVGRVAADGLELAREVHGRVSDECLLDVSPRGVAEELACRTTIRRTWGVIEQDAAFLPGFEPLHHEWSFGMEDGDAPEEFGEFSLAGRIDRIDTDGHTLILTDYKSGTIAAEHGAARFVSEGLIQLPLYATVASRRLGVDTGALLYRSFKGGKPRGCVREELKSSAFVSNDCLAPEEFSSVIAAGLARAGEAVEGMRAGRVDAEPLGGTCPDYCPARAFCSGWRPGRG